MKFACNRCGASDGITLPVATDPTDDASITCAACGARQPRREYELQRLRAELARAGSAARPAGPKVSTDEPAACPSCGDEQFTADFGCPRCGHGRKSFVARYRDQLVGIGFFSLLLLGACGVAVVGLLAPSNFASGVLTANGIFVLTGAFVFAFGIRALRDPTSLQIVDAAGKDAFGMDRYENPRQATREQGTRIGVVCLVLGFVVVIVGVFIGPIAQAIGIPVRG